MPAWLSYLQNEDTGVWEITGRALTGGYQGSLGCDLPSVFLGSLMKTLTPFTRLLNDTGQCGQLT